MRTEAQVSVMNRLASVSVCSPRRFDLRIRDPGEDSFGEVGGAQAALDGADRCCGRGDEAERCPRVPWVGVDVVVPQDMRKEVGKQCMRQS